MIFIFVKESRFPPAKRKCPSAESKSPSAKDRFPPRPALSRRWRSATRGQPARVAYSNDMFSPLSPSCFRFFSVSVPTFYRLFARFFPGASASPSRSDQGTLYNIHDTKSCGGAKGRGRSERYPKRPETRRATTAHMHTETTQEVLRTGS